MPGSFPNKNTKSFFSKTIEKVVIKKYVQKPISNNPLFLAKKCLRNLNKLQPLSPISFESLDSKRTVQVEIPRHVSLVVGKDNKVLVTGIRGSLIHPFDSDLAFEKKENSLVVSFSRETNSTASSTQIGILYRMLVGVTRGYKEKIKTSGVGYRGVLEEKQLLTLFLGYSHRAQHRLLPNVKAKFSRKNNKINFSGSS